MFVSFSSSRSSSSSSLFSPFSSSISFCSSSSFSSSSFSSSFFFCFFLLLLFLLLFLPVFFPFHSFPFWLPLLLFSRFLFNLFWSLSFFILCSFVCEVLNAVCSSQNTEKPKSWRTSNVVTSTLRVLERTCIRTAKAFSALRTSSPPPTPGRPSTKGEQTPSLSFLAVSHAVPLINVLCKSFNAFLGFYRYVVPLFVTSTQL